MESFDGTLDDAPLGGDPLPTKDRGINRWKVVDFGLIPKLLRLVLVNVSERFCGILFFPPYNP